MSAKQTPDHALDQARGVLFGLAVGDALGRPTEFLSLEAVKARYGPHGIQDLPDPALFTDDTQMALAIAEALVQAGDQDIETLMEAVKNEFILWAHSPENNRAPGRTCLEGIARMETGVHWSQSGIARSKGCGSAMRSAPIGLFYQHDPKKLRQVAHATGICTHGHPTADAACIGAAYLVKLALDQTPPNRMIPELLAFTEGISHEFDQAIHKVEDCLPWEDEEAAWSTSAKDGLARRPWPWPSTSSCGPRTTTEEPCSGEPTRTGTRTPLRVSRGPSAGRGLGWRQSPRSGPHASRRRGNYPCWRNGCD